MSINWFSRTPGTSLGSSVLSNKVLDFHQVSFGIGLPWIELLMFYMKIYNLFIILLILPPTTKHVRSKVSPSWNGPTVCSTFIPISSMKNGLLGTTANSKLKWLRHSILYRLIDSYLSHKEIFQNSSSEKDWNQLDIYTLLHHPNSLCPSEEQLARCEK